MCNMCEVPPLVDKANDGPVNMLSTSAPLQKVCHLQCCQMLLDALPELGNGCVHGNLSPAPRRSQACCRIEPTKAMSPEGGEGVVGPGRFCKENRAQVGGRPPSRRGCWNRCPRRWVDKDLSSASLQRLLERRRSSYNLPKCWGCVFGVTQAEW